MPLRTRLFILIALALAAIGLVTGILYWLKNKKTVVANQSTSAPQVIETNNYVQPTPAQPTVIPAGLPIKPVTTLEMQQNAVKQLAKIFIERYNSFSSENKYQNIIDARALVTETLWTRISQALTKPPSSSFIGVTTEAVNATLSNWTDTQADFLVKTRRTTEKDGTQSEQYQDVTITLKKINNAWLVDSFAVTSTK